MFPLQVTISGHAFGVHEAGTKTKLRNHDATLNYWIYMMERWAQAHELVCAQNKICCVHALLHTFDSGTKYVICILIGREGTRYFVDMHAHVPAQVRILSIIK